MLFYNEKDEICSKVGDDVKILYDWDIVEVDKKLYTYVYGYFYDGIDYGDGDYETDWEKRTHPRHMNINEISKSNVELNRLYAIYYNNEPFRMKNKKNVYYTAEFAENALRSLSRRIARAKIESWKNYSESERKKLIQKEIDKFTIVEYVEVVERVIKPSIKLQ